MLNDLDTHRSAGHARPSNAKSYRDTTGHNKTKKTGHSRFTSRAPQAHRPGHEKSGISGYNPESQ